MKSIFPRIIETFPQEDRASSERKRILHERLLYRYLQRKIEGWSVNDFLTAEKIDKYVLYAVTDFTELFINDLDHSQGNAKPENICDKNADIFQTGFKGRAIISPDVLVNMYKNGEVNKVIIMSVLHENEIVSELLKRGILLNDIISFVSVLYA